MGVYKVVPIQKCWDETGKAPIGIRWVDHDKGSGNFRNYRCRLVAKEFNKGKNDEM